MDFLPDFSRLPPPYLLKLEFRLQGGSPKNFERPRQETQELYNLQIDSLGFLKMQDIHNKINGVIDLFC